MIDSFRTRWARQVFSLDLRSLALLRLTLSAVLIGDLLAHFTVLDALYTDGGALPRSIEQAIVPGAFWSVLNINGGSGFAAAVFLLAVVAAAAFCVGYHTRLANLVSWVLLVSIQNRNPLVYHCGDNLIRLALFWCLFLPVGERFSIDGHGVEPRRSAALSAGTFCFVMQILLVFGCLLDHKLMGHAWRSGMAVEEALSVGQYQRAFGRWLLAYPALLSPLTYATLASQGVMVVLLLLPWRAWPRLLAVASTLGMQVGFGLSFRLGHFPWTTSAVMLALIPGEAWDWAARWAAPLRAPVIAPRLSGGWTSFLALASLFLVMLWNLGESGATFTLHGRDEAIPDMALGHLAEALRLDQRWSMFAPNPQTEDGWVVLAGQTETGQTLNVLPWLLGAPRADDRMTAQPKSIASALGYGRSQRWALELLDLVEDPEPPALAGLAAYGCRQWNATAIPGQHIRDITIIYEKFEHLGEGQTSPVIPERLWEQPCLASRAIGS